MYKTHDERDIMCECVNKTHDEWCDVVMIRDVNWRMNNATYNNDNSSSSCIKWVTIIKVQIQVQVQVQVQIQLQIQIQLYVQIQIWLKLMFYI